jgi:hypothetical protein
MHLAIAHNRTKQKKAVPFRTSTFLIVAAVVLGFLDVFLGGPIAESIGEGRLIVLRWILSCIIVIFGAVAVALSIKFASPATMIGEISILVFLRVAGLLLPLVLFLFAFPGEIQIAIFVMIVLFLISPPSSWVESMLREAGASSDTFGRMVRIDMSWNALLIGVVALLTGFFGFRAILPDL